MIPIPSLSVGAWIKLGAAVAVAGAVLWLGIEFDRRGDRIDELKAAVDSYEDAVGRFKSANADWAKADQLRRETAEADRKARETAAAQAREQVASSKAAAAAAEKRAAKWRDQFNNRPQGCAAALAALDTACPSLRGF